MSTNKTDHFELHSWVPEDNFQLSEINENFDKLDASARMILGIYTGNQLSYYKTPQHISVDLGGRIPKAVFLMGCRGGFATSNIRWLFNIAGIDKNVLTFTKDGFDVLNDEDNGVYANSLDLLYYYMVFY